MVGRPHLSLVPAHGIRLRLRAPSPRALGAAAALVGVAGLCYLAARETSLFALRDVRVTGAPPAVAREVRRATDAHVGQSLVALDPGGLRRRLEALPTVRSVDVDRAFPHTLRITVAPERPLAILRQGKEAWLLSDRGRVIRAVDSAVARRPRVRAADELRLAEGDVVAARDVRRALAVLRKVPRSFPVRVAEARVGEGAVALGLAGGTELRLGARRSLALKLAVAARVLRAIPAAERESLGYVDVSVPERPVAETNAQLSG